MSANDETLTSTPAPTASSAISSTALASLQGEGSRLLPVLGGPALITAFANGVSGHVLARILGLRPGTTAPGSLSITQVTARHAGDSVDGERWCRNFGGARWASTLASDDAAEARRASARDSITAAADSDALVEHIGPLTLRFAVALDPAWVTTMSLRSVHLGTLRLPLGRRCGLTAQIAPDAATDVIIDVPRGSCGYHVDFRSQPCMPRP